MVDHADQEVVAEIVEINTEGEDIAETDIEREVIVETDIEEVDHEVETGNKKL